MAEAEASFNTDIDVISEEFRKSILSKKAPSTTKSGPDAPKLYDPIPRTLTVGEDPGAPLLTICRPATFPCRACIAEPDGVFTISSVLTVVMAEVRSLTLISPYP